MTAYPLDFAGSPRELAMVLGYPFRTGGVGRLPAEDVWLAGYATRSDGTGPLLWVGQAPDRYLTIRDNPPCREC